MLLTVNFSLLQGFSSLEPGKGRCLNCSRWFRSVHLLYWSLHWGWWRQGWWWWWMMMHCFLSDSKIHSDPKRARHCSPQYALPHLKVGRCRKISKLVIWQKNPEPILMKSSHPSNISQLMNYVGFATWFSIGAAVSPVLTKRWQWEDFRMRQFPSSRPKPDEIVHQVLCVPWLRWKCPELERPIRVSLRVLRNCFKKKVSSSTPFGGLSGWASLFSLSPEMGLPSWECPFSAFWKSNYKFHNRALVKKILEAFDS